MPAQIEAVIFDMDGLMIDSEGKQSISLEKMLKEHGAIPEPKEHGLVQIVGMRLDDNLKLLKDKHNLAASIDDLRKRKNEIYRELLVEGVDIMPGLIELLADLEEAFVKKALASGSHIDDIKVVLKHMGLENYFDAQVSGYEVAAGKPEPDIFLEAAKRLEINPENCAVLEDAAVGVEAAKTAGMRAIAVQGQYSQGQDFGKADLVVSSLLELSWERISSL